MKLVAYARKSLEKMSGEFSIDAQVDAMKHWASERDHEIVTIYKDGIDEDASGGDATRKEYSMMKDAVTRGFCDGVLIYKLDRLARDVKEFLTVLDDFYDKHNVKIYVVTFPDSLDLYSTEGRTFIQMNMIFAEHEKRVITDRIRHGIKQKMKKEWFGQPPYGFKVVSDHEKVGTKVKARNTRLVMQPEEMRIRSRIMDLDDAGHSISEIMHLLNREGVPTRKGRKWSASTVRSIINANLSRVMQFVDQDGEEE